MKADVFPVCIEHPLAATIVFVIAVHLWDMLILFQR